MTFYKHHVLKLAMLFISIIEDMLQMLQMLQTRSGQDDGTATLAKPTN
jgi:hypothetical protein